MPDVTRKATELLFRAHKFKILSKASFQKRLFVLQ